MKVEIITRMGSGERCTSRRWRRSAGGRRGRLGSLVRALSHLEAPTCPSGAAAELMTRTRTAWKLTPSAGAAAQGRGGNLWVLLRLQLSAPAGRKTLERTGGCALAPPAAPPLGGGRSVRSRRARTARPARLDRAEPPRRRRRSRFHPVLNGGKWFGGWQRAA